MRGPLHTGPLTIHTRRLPAAGRQGESRAAPSGQRLERARRAAAQAARHAEG